MSAEREQAQGKQDRKQEQTHEKRWEPPAVEWVVAALGLLLVAASIGVLLYEAFAREDAPPAVVVEVDGVQPVEGGFLVLFHAANRGGRTAATLLVEGELRRGDETVERSEATIDYSPARSERHGGLFFTHDPAAFELRLRALGYAEP
jgi:uncharacterized protein (TIGR02588 family)